MRAIVILTMIFLVTGSSWAQSRRELADQALEHNEYWAAIELYKKHLEKDRNPGNKGEVYYNIGECYRNLTMYKDALDWYDKAQGAQYTMPNLYFQKGKTLLNLGQYDKAKEALNAFLELQPNDQDAVRMMKNVDFALSMKNDPPPLYTIVNESSLNTEFSDYGAVPFENQVVFTSSRMVDDNKTYQVDGQGFSNLFMAHYDNADKVWDQLKAITGLSSNYNDGVFTYCPKTKTAYYSQCSGDKGALCRVMQSTYDATAQTWSEPQLITFAGDDIEMVHPSISADGQYLFVVSRDLEGSLGSDILVLTEQGGGWGEPQRIDAINSDYDEAYPVWHNDTTLYFSSNGFVGMGGLDLFVSIKRNGKWTKPSNLRAPFNSSADDFLYNTNEDNTKGYFSSNRDGGSGSDDIYSYYMTPITLTVNGHVNDADTKGNLQGVKVYLLTADGAVDSTLTDANGDYSFLLDKNEDYKLILALPEYFGDSRKLSTVGELYSKTFSKANGYNYDFSLMRIPEEEITIDDIFYDYNSASLRPESMASLNKLVKLLEDSPDISVVINSHTDDRGDDAYNLRLSDARAKSVVEYLVSKGINPVRLESKGWGETKLLIKHAKTEEEHQQNRRTTFKVVK